MKINVGDLIQFSEKHWNRQGFRYCASWKGTVVEKQTISIEDRYKFRYVVYWSCGVHGYFIGKVFDIGDPGLEVISASY